MRIALVMNCHWRPAKLALECLMTNAVEIDVFGLDTPSRNDLTLQSAFLESLPTKDLIFYQKHSDRILSGDAIKSAAPSKSFKVSNLFFRGLHPDACYVGDFVNRFATPFPYNSIVILDAFKRGLSRSECLNSFNAGNFARLGLLDVASESLDRLAARDADAIVPGSPLIAEHWTRKQLFYTINHPTFHLVVEYYKLILSKLNINFSDFNTQNIIDPLHNICMYPVFDFVADAASLNFRTSQLWRRHDRYDTLEAMVDRFYEAYEATENIQALTINSPLHKHFHDNKEEFGHLVTSVDASF